MESERIYLDHNATTAIDPDVVESMRDVWLAGPANPASQHQRGQRARRQLERARESIASQLDLRLTPPNQEDRLVFTSGGTEANNMLLSSLRRFPQARLIVSRLEHPSISRAAEAAGMEGVQVEYCQILSSGELDLEDLRQRLQAPATLVSCMLANNETGVVQPVAAAAELCRTAGVPLHSDATQVVGKHRVSFQELGLSAMTFAAHKFHGPIGLGGLIMRQGLQLQPLLHGGFQQLGTRPGTEAVALAVGTEIALRRGLQHATSEEIRLRQLRDDFERRIRAEVPEIVVHGASAERLPHVSCLGFPSVDGQALFVALDQHGIDCSTGSACASGSAETSPVLLAMGVSEELARNSLRFSFGRLNQDSDAAQAAERIIACFKDLHRSSRPPN